MLLRQASLAKDGRKLKQLKQLINDGAQIDERNDRGETALLLAAQNGYLEAVELLIHSGADVDSRDQNGRSPLFYAYQKGHELVVEALVEAGADTSVSDAKSGESPIYTACHWGHSVSELHALITAGADINIQKRDGWTPLHTTCRNGHVIVVRELVKCGADVDTQDQSGGTALMLACRSGHMAVVEALISANVDVNLQRNSGDTSLHTATHNGHVTVVERLIRAGAIVNIRGENGRSPLHTACACGHDAVMQALISANADIDLQDDKGWTPFFTATLRSRKSAVQLLLEYGASAEVSPHWPPVTCLQIACFTGCFDIVKIILLHLAKKSFDVAQFLSPLCAKTAAQCTARLLSGSECINYASRASGAPHEHHERQLSSQLHDQFNKAGFTCKMAALQSTIADVMQHIERRRRGWNRIFLVGSFSEGWGNSLTCLRGRTDLDSDIDVTEFVAGRLYHLKGRCNCQNVNPEAIVEYENGHVTVAISANTPARHDYGSTLRPAFDKVDAYECCCYPNTDILCTSGRQCHLPQSLLDSLRDEARQPGCHLVAAAPPGLAGHRLRMSTTFLEKLFMRSLSDVQGQLFILLKFIVKKVIPEKAKGLKTFHSKCLVFYMVDETPAGEWQPCNLVGLARRALQWLLDSLRSSEFGPDECLRHFFLRDAIVYLRIGHSGKEQIAEAVAHTIENLHQHIVRLEGTLRPIQNQGGRFYFHPFLDIPYMFLNYLSSSRTLEYEEIYGCVRDLVLQMSGTSSSLDSLISTINRIPDCAKTARETLKAMAFLKFKESALAIGVLRLVKDHTVSRGISFDVTDKSADDRFRMVWQHINSSDSAWKFVLDSHVRPTFDFSPKFVRDAFPLKIDRYEQFFFLNFDAMKKCLLLELTDDCAGESADWFTEAAQSEDADAQELVMALHYCRDTQLLVQLIHNHRSVIVNDLLARDELLLLMSSQPDLLETSCKTTLKKLLQDISGSN